MAFILCFGLRPHALCQLVEVEVDTGVVKSVSNCETISPPTMLMPSGLRSSAPTPPPSASGKPPSSAAIVVIMIGRKRSRQAWKIASSAVLPSAALGLQGKVDHHDGVLLHNANQQNDADERDYAELLARDQQASNAPTPAEGSVEIIVMGWM